MKGREVLNSNKRVFELMRIKGIPYSINAINGNITITKPNEPPRIFHTTEIETLEKELEINYSLDKVEYKRNFEIKWPF